MTTTTTSTHRLTADDYRTIKAVHLDMAANLDALITILKAEECSPEQAHDAAARLRHIADRIETLGGPLPTRVLPPGVIDLARRRRSRRVGTGAVR